jgi:dihydrofolate synthase/folylpolyglutamate synthase
MLKDKDIAGVVAALGSAIAHWFIAPLDVPRGAGIDQLDAALAAAGAGSRTRCSDVASAYAQACDMAMENDRIAVFGSFYTVASVMRIRARRAAG